MSAWPSAVSSPWLVPACFSTALVVLSCEPSDYGGACTGSAAERGSGGRGEARALFRRTRVDIATETCFHIKSQVEQTCTQMNQRLLLWTSPCGEQRRSADLWYLFWYSENISGECRSATLLGPAHKGRPESHSVKIAGPRVGMSAITTAVSMTTSP